MKKQILTVAIAFLVVGEIQFAVGQNPNQIFSMNKADSLREAGDLKGTIVAYRLIVEKDPNTLFNMYNYACALGADRQLDSCFKYLYKAIELETSLIPLMDKDFYFARQDKRWEAFEEKLVANNQAKPNVVIKNWELARKLFRLGVFDQAYYDELKIAGSKLGMSSSVTHALMDLKDKINNENQQELESIIQKYGFPKISDVGKDAANAAFMVIQHSDVKTQKKYLSLIKNLCEENEASWSSYALMYDRIQVSEKKTQRYGTQFKINETTRTVELLPMEDETKVDEWRKEMGLQPEASYLKFLRWQYEPKKK